MMQNFTDFLAMGGHGPFIWSAYGAAAFILIGLLVMSMKELQSRKAEIAALEASSPRRRQQSGDA